MFSCILSESLNEPEAFHLAHWQAVAFNLPQAKQEAAIWWATSLAVLRLHFRDYMPSPTSTDLSVRRQQETMDLARALQACTEESKSPTGVLCDGAWELQRCMAPLLALNGDEIV